MTHKNNRDELYIGCISGTSIDAMDCVLTSINSTGQTRVLAHHSEALNESLRAYLHDICETQTSTLITLGEADVEVARSASSGIRKLLSKAGFSPKDIRAIGSHGQTICHQPSLRFSMQIGSPSVIAEETGIPVVADMRMSDMAAGGQGAPLAPAFHAAQFSTDDETRAVINIGGISNITWLKENDIDNTMGFDIGPGNTLMDLWVRTHLSKEYDAGGAWAKSGTLNQELLNHFFDEPYLALPPPKSTGRELFNAQWLKAKLSRFGELPDKDVQRTLLEYTALTIAQELQTNARVKAAYICGGGAYNHFLLERLQALSGIKIYTTEALGIPPQQVEGAAFAWMARQTIHNLPGNLPSVTGAKKAKVMGGIYHP